jgi:hypothetical protein
VGKRQRHSDLVDYSAKELEDRLRNDKSLTSTERLKIVAELKFWKERNRQKRSK